MIVELIVNNSIKSCGQFPIQEPMYVSLIGCKVRLLGISSGACSATGQGYST